MERDLSTPSVQQLLKYTSSVDRYILKRYSGRRPSPSLAQAQTDAIIFGLSRFQQYSLELFIHSPETHSPEEFILAEEEARRWHKDVELAKYGDWRDMKTHLKDDARSSMESAAYRLQMDLPADEIAEARGEALIRLASLI